MNTTASAASLSTAEASEEVTLGWNTMPAYGEVMTELFGAQQVTFEAPSTRPAPVATTSLFLENFWSTVRNQFVALAA